MILGNPIGLIGLLSLPVIIILHLLRRRQRPYIVSHLGLWAFLDSEARGPRRRNIPITWILLADLLIAALLSLAWAQPRVHLDLPGSQVRHMVILIDISSSMNASANVRQTRISEAKDIAGRLLENTTPRDVVTVIAFGRQARIISDSRQNGAGIADQVQAVQAGETGSALREALALGQASLEETLPPEFHVITDGNLPEENQEIIEGFPYPLMWHLVNGPANNQAVIELNATPFGAGSYQVFARLANFGDRPVSRVVTLSVGEQPVNQTIIDLPAGSTVPQVWQIPVEGSDGLEGIHVALSGTDSLAEDDSAAISLQSGENVRVALVADDPMIVQQAIQAIPNVDLTRFTPAEYTAASEQQTLPVVDLTIFRNYQPPNWPAGQVLVIDPPEQGSEANSAPPQTVTFYTQSSREIPAGSAVRFPNPSALVEGIDFSGVRWARAWNLVSISSGFTALLQAEEIPILLEGEVRVSASERSRVIVLLADLSRGNFTKHPAFPIFIANLVEQSRQAPLPPGFQTGEAIPLPVTGSYEMVEVTPPGKSPVKLSQDWPSEWTNTLDPGLYHFRFIEADGNVSEYSAGARAGDAAESDLHPRSWVQSAASANTAGEGSIIEENEQFDLRPWLLGAAILALLLEAILAWRS